MYIYQSGHGMYNHEFWKYIGVVTTLFIAAKVYDSEISSRKLKHCNHWFKIFIF